MLIYCAHRYGGDAKNIERADKLVKKLQFKYPQHTFISPLKAFSMYDYNELGYEQEMEMCKDLLTVCDELLIMSELSNGVKIEKELAELIGMPIKELENENLL